MNLPYPGKTLLLLVATAAFLFIVTSAFTANNEEEKASTAAAAAEKASDSQEPQEPMDIPGVKATSDGSTTVSDEDNKKMTKELQKALSKYKKHNPKTNEFGAISLVTAPHSLELTVVTVEPEGNTSYQCMTAEEMAATAAKNEEEKKQ